MVEATERQALVEQIKGIRVTDWHDALDTLGLFDRGLMSPDIRPLWRDFERFAHCIRGFAFTVRVVPSSNAIVARDAEDFRRQEREWYAAEGRWADKLKPGDLIVVDARVSRDCGFIGSQNSLQWLARGAVGIVSSGGARDTDEVIKQKVPVYCREFFLRHQPGPRRDCLPPAAGRVRRRLRPSRRPGGSRRRRRHRSAGREDSGRPAHRQGDRDWRPETAREALRATGHSTGLHARRSRAWGGFRGWHRIVLTPLRPHSTGGADTAMRNARRPSLAGTARPHPARPTPSQARGRLGQVWPSRRARRP